MKDMSQKDLFELRKELSDAKIRVLLNHGFTVKEVSNLLGISEEMIIRRFIKNI